MSRGGGEEAAGCRVPGCWVGLRLTREPPSPPNTHHWPSPREEEDSYRYSWLHSAQHNRILSIRGITHRQTDIRFVTRHLIKIPKKAKRVYREFNCEKALGKKKLL